MIMTSILLSFLSSLLLAAHFLREGTWGWVALSLLFPLLLLNKRRWSFQALALFYLLGTYEWLQTTLTIYEIRQITGEPWLRMAMIMAGVALFTGMTAWSLYRLSLRSNFPEYQPGANTAAVWVFTLTFALLSFIRWKVTSVPMLLFDRFIPGAGWLEIFALSLYGAFVVEKMMNPKTEQTMRLRIWKIFSIVFFVQLGLGFTVSSVFLMTGALHIPVPALIIAGPLYRGEGFFMPILFLSTIILVGPAWCSHLCYFGAWDNAAAHPVKRPQSLRQWAEPTRVGILIGIILVALILRFLGVSPVIAAIIGILFGFSGIAVMLFISRKRGIMAHCTAYCPIGLLAVLLGRINPFRIKINEDCTDCNACTRACRYDALSPANIKNRAAGYTCTLCGDCIASCHVSALEYRFAGFSPAHSRRLFLILIITLHAVFMGLARM